jgi:galactonate dehydratase
VARIAEVRLDRLQITPRTVWIFLAVITDDGRTGWGEATLPRDPAAVAAAAEAWLDALAGLPLDRALALRTGSGMAHAALRSSLDMALLDLEGQRTGQPVHALLGGARRDKVLLYANINRRTTPRTPEAFAASARLAADRGYGIFKLAPFDEITPEVCREDDLDALLELGLGRIAAARAAVGPEATLRVDCHWRFDHAGALRMIDACSAFGLDWIECPVAEEVAAADAIAALRRHSNARGMRLAGLETGIGLAAFAPFLAAGAYDVIMPDVKYLGGLGLFAELGGLARRHGAVLSPHNPSGPVCHAASLHVACALEAVDSLEHQFDETPLFDALVGSPLAAPRHGLALVPQAPGLGVSLDHDLVVTLRHENGRERKS